MVNHLVTDLIGEEAKDVRFSICMTMELDGATTYQVSKFQQVTALDFYILYLANTYTGITCIKLLNLFLLSRIYNLLHIT